MPDNFIDLTITSPPYDNLRDYEGYSFDFKSIADGLYRVTKQGGVIVWIVADATIKSNETGTSFKQALYFKEIGFNLHDTMIWNKCGFTAPGSLLYRYASVFEYMFILVKGRLKTFNPIKDRKTKHGGLKKTGSTIRQVNGTFKASRDKIINEYSQRFNVWDQHPHKSGGIHPAPFPEQLISDHIISWSNEDDLIFDPMCGSGTTLKMAVLNKRNYIGSDISKKYCDISINRINSFVNLRKFKEDHGVYE